MYRAAPRLTQRSALHILGGPARPFNLALGSEPALRMRYSVLLFVAVSGPIGGANPRQRRTTEARHVLKKENGARRRRRLSEPDLKLESNCLEDIAMMM